MRPIQPHRRSAASLWIAMVFVVFFVGAGGIVTSLWLLGFNLNPFAGREDPYMVRLPINSQPIPAYARVDRGHLLNPKTGGLMYQRVPPQATIGMSITGVATDGSPVQGKVAAVKRVGDGVVFVAAGGQEIPQEQVSELGGVLMNVSAIIGRVVKKDKRVGLAFQESTFFEQGTPEGLAGATPPGMRSLTLDAAKLIGVHSLSAGDHVDLLASVPISEAATIQSATGSRLSGAALVASTTGDKSKSSGTTEPILLAKNALVLKPVYVRNEIESSSSLTQGKKLQNVPKYEVALAVADDDVIPLQGALDRKLNITCVSHSMQPTTTTAVASQPSGPVAPVTVRAIMAYDVVARDAFINPATRRPRLESISQQEIDRLGIVTSFDQALGAVARHDIPAGSFLRKSDLLSKPLEAPSPDKSAAEAKPYAYGLHFTALQGGGHQHGPAESPARTGSVVGDRPAVSGFIPAGYTAFALPWNRMYGAEYLEIGDHIDLLASYSLESENKEEETETRPDGTTIVRKKEDVATRETRRTWDETIGARGEPWFVATEAIVVGPVGFPPPAPAQRALGDQLNRSAANSGQNATGYSGPPVIVAVDDRDVENLATALATKRALFTPTFHRSEDHAAIPTGMKRIAIAAQDIEAYQQLEETAWQGNRRRPMWRLVNEDDTRFSQALEAHDIAGFYGRVLNQAKRRGDFITPADFLPVGTSPGVAAAAGPGRTIFAVADKEIEGVDSFQTNDQVAILIRGVVKPLTGVTVHGLNLQRPVSSVIVPEARIARASRGGQTVLEIKNEDLTRLQAAWAASISQPDEQGGGGEKRRSHLLAVALPRGGQESDARRFAMFRQPETEVPIAAIAPFDPIGEVTIVETLVGKQRETHAFAASRGSSDQKSLPFNFVGQ